jgi:glycine oxidase
MSPPDVDTLIIGQGLAGSALAWFLLHAGERVCVLDDGHVSASSIVAAGLVNPLAGMRFTRRPELDDWLTAAECWYADLGRTLQRPCFHPLPMLRLFRSAGQVRFYERRSADPGAAGLVGAAFAANACPEPVSAPHGGFVQQRTGHVDLPGLLADLRRWLTGHGAYRKIPVGYRDITVGARCVDVAGLRARRLVFCDGARLRDNPWLDALPLAPAKGEVLDIEAGGWRPRHIVNGAHWLVPQAGRGHRLRLGATHDHEHLDLQPTAAGRQELLAGYAALGAPDVTQVTAHLAGIRPGTPDHYPLLGAAADAGRLFVFNGLGARGTLTAPWYAERLAAHLTGGAPLPVEADIRRFA